MARVRNMLRSMRRLAALLSVVALAHSVVLRTGVLCESADAAPAMAGMETGPASHAHHHAGRHDGAHCPLMADCVVAAVTAPPVEVSSVSRPVDAVSIAREMLPRSETAAPEPPPPKG